MINLHERKKKWEKSLRKQKPYSKKAIKKRRRRRGGEGEKKHGTKMQRKPTSKRKENQDMV